jgi:flagellin
VLDGSTDYSLTGRNSSQVRRLEVYRRGSQTPTISGSVTQAAEQASLDYHGAGHKIKNDAVFTLTGSRGAATVTVTKNGALDEAAEQINAQSHHTGVTASVAGNTLTFTSVDYGTDASVAVDVVSGTFHVTGGHGDGTATGADAEVTINGSAVAAGQVSGNTVTYARNGLHFRLRFQPGFSGDFDSITVHEGGAMRFALSPDVNRITTVALPSISAARLGGVSGRLTDLAAEGSLAGLGDNTSQAIRVVDEALAQLDLVEARVGSFAETTIASSAALMDGMAEVLDSNGDGVVDLNESDQEAESLLLTRNQSLAANALASLAIVQQQQQSVLVLLHRMAGLA